MWNTFSRAAHAGWAHPTGHPQGLDWLCALGWELDKGNAPIYSANASCWALLPMGVLAHHASTCKGRPSGKRNPPPQPNREHCQANRKAGKCNIWLWWSHAVPGWAALEGRALSHHGDSCYLSTRTQTVDDPGVNRAPDKYFLKYLFWDDLLIMYNLFTL